MCGSDWNRPKDYRRAVVIDKRPKKYDEREHSSEWMQKSVQKRFDRADVVRDVRLSVPAQPVVATPFNTLIRQSLPGRSSLFSCTRSKPSQGSVPAMYPSDSILVFVFNTSWAGAECCVDPLRSPD